jgi:hypothetical protein
LQFSHVKRQDLVVCNDPSYSNNNFDVNSAGNTQWTFSTRVYLGYNHSGNVTFDDFVELNNSTGRSVTPLLLDWDDDGGKWMATGATRIGSLPRLALHAQRGKTAFLHPSHRQCGASPNISDL